MQPRLIVMSLLTLLATSACSVVGIRSGTEQPRYAVLGVEGPLEVREYGPRLAAETEVAGSEVAARSEGFRRLAGFIFGGNTGAVRIGMTAPVGQTGGQEGTAIAMTAPVVAAGAGPGRWRIRFFMPAGYTEATLPRPRDPAVRIVAVPGQVFAVYRYSGSISPAAVAEAGREVVRRVRATPWTAEGAPVAWFYDPPWTLPFLRRNEAAVEVRRGGGAGGTEGG